MYICHFLISVHISRKKKKNRKHLQKPNVLSRATMDYTLLFNYCQHVIGFAYFCCGAHRIKNENALLKPKKPVGRDIPSTCLWDRVGSSRQSRDCRPAEVSETQFVTDASSRVHAETVSQRDDDSDRWRFVRI